MKFNFRNLLLASLVMLISLPQIQCANKDANGKEQKNATANTDTTANKANPQKDLKGDDLIPVEVTQVGKGKISSFLLLSSNLETEKMADVYSRVQGLVRSISVEEGQYVEKGQVMMELEADEYTLAEQKARVVYEQAQSDFERAQEMFKKELLSKEEFDKARFSMEGSKISWQEAKLNLDYTKITTPISGLIGDRLRRIGDRIQPADKLFTVVNLDEMIAVVHIPEKELGLIEKGQKTYLTSENLKGQRFTGWIKRVSPIVDPQSGTFKVTIGVSNTAKTLRPGMFVNAHIIIDTHENTVLVPKLAIVFENESMNVFVVRDSVAHKITLNTGFQDHEKVEALSDVRDGDKIIVVGQAGLKDNTKVKIVSERPNVL